MATRDEFEKMVIEAVERLPEHVRAKIHNVDFIVEGSARAEKSNEVGIRRGDILLGLYEGVPRTERGGGYFGVLPDRITIFQQAIEETCADDPAALRKFVFQVIWHEIGHYFGFSESEIRRLEAERFPGNHLDHS